MCRVRSQKKHWIVMRDDPAASCTVDQATMHKHNNEICKIQNVSVKTVFYRWLQKLSIKVQVLNANLVAMPYGDACHTRSAKPNAGASVQRAVVVQQAQMGNHRRPVVRNVQAVIGT
jgi:hypothetical protein